MAKKVDLIYSKRLQELNWHQRNAFVESIKNSYSYIDSCNGCHVNCCQCQCFRPVFLRSDLATSTKSPMFLSLTSKNTLYIFFCQDTATTRS